ncbi:MAG: hypothetical protein HY299_02505 [Verrucomicrobia bacterium]|nr:hypothetical protein [Verrucomicrobiota bacterium]
MSDEADLTGGSGDEFARIDLVTNHTVFRDPDHYHALLRQRDLPVDTFSSFIHEATHHWCFISPVGTALSFLFLSAAKRTLRALAKRNDSLLNQALDDLCAFDIAVRFLRPLNEGLAQFAEYDVRPSETADLASPPLLATLGHLFNMRARLGDRDADHWREKSYAFQDDLTRWRVSQRSIDRKCELLLQPLEADRSAYLLGYLTVKQLWKNAIRFYDELRSADVFLILIRKLIFADYSLVEALLDRKQPPRARGLNFARLLHDRLNWIRLMPFAEETPWSEFEQVLASPSRDEGAGLQIADPVPFAALDTKRAVKRGLKLYRERFREVAEVEPFPLQGDLANVPPDIFFDIVRERYLMWLGDLPARWKSTGKNVGHVMAHDAVLYEGYKLTESSDEGLDALRLDLYIDLYRGFQVTTIGNERGVFGMALPDTVAERVRKDVFAARLDRARIVRWMDVFQRLMRNVMSHTDYSALMSKFWSKEMRGLLTLTYLDYAVDSDKKAESLLLKKGFGGVLEGDPELVRNVAAISLAASAELSMEGLVSLSDMALKPDEAIRRVAALWPIANFPLATIGRDGFPASVV